VADTEDRYGWLSIVLHWLIAALVITLWILGKSIDGADDEDARRALHMSVAMTAWLLIAFRIAWRLREGHPRVAGVSDLTHRIAKVNHYLMLISVSLMLLSGPLMAWANGAAIPLFGGVTVPGPFPPSDAIRDVARGIHGISANVLLLLVVLHIGGALKHLMFHADDVFARMLWPGRHDGVQDDTR